MTEIGWTLEQKRYSRGQQSGRDLSEIIGDRYQTLQNQIQYTHIFYPIICLTLETHILVVRDDLFSAPKLSWSFSNSDLRHLQHPSDSDHLQVLEMLHSTSYSKPLPAVPNATTRSFHSDPLPDTPSEGCSETSASSKGNPETSSDSAPSNLNSALMFFGDSPSCSGDRVTPVASDIKGQVIKVICNIKGQWWSGSMGNAG